MGGPSQTRRRKTALAKLRRFARRLPQRFRTRVLILAYHRVAAVPWDPAEPVREPGALRRAAGGAL